MKLKLLVVATVALLATACDSVETVTPVGNVVRGEQIFAQECSKCHTVTGQRYSNLMGSDLKNVYQRQADATKQGRRSNMYMYAGKNDLRWTEENLKEFMKNPTAFLEQWLRDNVNGSRERRLALRGSSYMGVNLDNRNDIDDIVAYLYALDTDVYEDLKNDFVDSIDQ